MKESLEAVKQRSKINDHRKCHMHSRVIHKYELLIFFMGHPPIMFHLMKKKFSKNLMEIG